MLVCARGNSNRRSYLKQLVFRAIFFSSLILISQFSNKLYTAGTSIVSTF